MRPSRRISGAVILAMAILLAQNAAPQTSGQTQQQAGAKPLQYEVSVALKLIHVYVTDRKGNPVKDLAIGDFLVADDGRPVTVTDFEKRVLKAAAARS